MDTVTKILSFQHNHKPRAYKNNINLALTWHANDTRAQYCDVKNNKYFKYCYAIAYQ